MLLLGIDTCGLSGSVALGQLTVSGVAILYQVELEGRTYSATLVSAIADVLARHGMNLPDLACMVAVDGPGSFTGLRVGLSAVKGLAEGAGLPIVTASRLEVLARTAGVANAAIDAHRHEVFLRLGSSASEFRELLAASADLQGLLAPDDPVAVCDDPAETLLAAAWPSAKLVRVPAPTASDALRATGLRVRAGEFADSALLDGRYLRRSDAEIFGDSQASQARRA